MGFYFNMASFHEKDVEISGGSVNLEGHLVVPANASGIVIFAHGSGSSRNSPRNKYVANILQQSGMATLLFDLLTAEEERLEYYTRHLRFDIQLLATRLMHATRWVGEDKDVGELAIGYFGSSTGAAAALVAASEMSERINSVVSRGGRPDLAGPALGIVRSATLLIVGGNDEAVLRLNEEAYARLNCEKELEVIPGATHLFEEAGTLESAANVAAKWFARHLEHHTV